MLWFWRFITYSFFGFLLEVAYARSVHHPKLDRKCFILLPLCPVYGLGAVLILWLTRALDAGPPGVLIIGFLAATAAEYGMGLFYERALGVRFWDYSDLPHNLGGKVCLTFSVCWTALALALVYWVSPVVDIVLRRVPAVLAPPALILLVCDAVTTSVALRRAGTTEVLRWYR